MNNAFRKPSKFLKKLFPSRFNCVICNAELDTPQNGRCICAPCSESLPWVERPCAKCGKQTDEREGICLYCQKQKPSFEKCSSPFLYQGNIKNAYLQYKFHDKSSRGEYFADFLADEYLKDNYHCDCVTATPSFRKNTSKKLKLNHSEYMAYELSRKLGLPFFTDLIKTKKTPPQVGLDFDQRTKNLWGAFEVKSDVFRGKTVLLVDDVLTTGSTMREISKTLKKQGGAKKVFCLTLLTAKNDFERKKQ